MGRIGHNALLRRLVILFPKAAILALVTVKTVDMLFVDKPSPPQDLSVTGYTRDSISVSWTAPESDGGSPILSYIVERRDAKRNTWMTAGSTKPEQLEFTVSKLIEGNEYLIRVFAENDVGASESVESQPLIAKMPFGESHFFRYFVLIKFLDS